MNKQKNNEKYLKFKIVGNVEVDKCTHKIFKKSKKQQSWNGFQVFDFRLCKYQQKINRLYTAYFQK